ncbi:MAG: radical SAM protein [archaeon]
MNVLLCIPPTQLLELSFPTKPRIPIGVAFLVTMLKDNNIPCQILDCEAEKLDLKDFKLKVTELKPDLIGFYCNTPQRFLVFEMARIVKSVDNNIKVVVGGPHVSVTDVEVLDFVPEIDFIIRGEGEFSIVELSKAVESKKDDFSEIKGLSFRKDGIVQRNPDRPFIQDLDELPFPDRSLFKVEKYTTGVFGYEKDVKSTMLKFARGCPMNCVFCDNRVIWGKGVRTRSITNIIKELTMLNKEQGFQGFDVYDDTFNLNLSWAKELCREIIKSGLDIKWYCTIRANSVDDEFFSLLKQSGCTGIGLGIESGSEQILKNIKKGITLDMVRNTVRLSQKHGIKVKSFILCNLPGEKLSDIDKTMNFMKELKEIGPDVMDLPVRPAVTIIYPKTEIEFIAKQKGLLPKDFNWEKPYYNRDNKLVGEDPQVPVYSEINLKLLALYFLIDRLKKQSITKLPYLMSMAFKRTFSRKPKH